MERARPPLSRPAVEALVEPTVESLTEPAVESLMKSPAPRPTPSHSWARRYTHTAARHLPRSIAPHKASRPSRTGTCRTIVLRPSHHLAPEPVAAPLTAGAGREAAAAAPEAAPMAR